MDRQQPSAHQGLGCTFTGIGRMVQLLRNCLTQIPLMTTCACGNCQFMDMQSKAAVKPKKDDPGLCRYNPSIAQAGSDALGLWPFLGAKD
jgi:hypothetical protein